jgi:hypothetical protein
MSITQGSALPNVTVTTGKAQTAPDYYTKYLEGLAGDTGVSKTMLDRTAAEGIAGYDPLQTTGYGMVESGAGAYKDYLSDAEKTAALPAAGIDAARIGQLMDPYRTNVVDEMARLSQQNIQRNVLPSLKAGFVGSGNLGSQRYAGALGQSLADIQTNLTGQQYGALSKGYSEALKASLDELQLQNEAARTQLGMAEKAQQMGLTEAGALTKAGAEQQAYEQAKLDYPLKTALEVAGLMRGLQVPMSETETRTGPLPGAYETSDLANVLGILTALGSIKTGGGSSVGGDFLSWAAKGFKDILPSDWSNLFGSNVTGTEAQDRMSEDDYRRLFPGGMSFEDYQKIFPGATLPDDSGMSIG